MLVFFYVQLSRYSMKLRISRRFFSAVFLVLLLFAASFSPNCSPRRDLDARTVRTSWNHLETPRPFWLSLTVSGHFCFFRIIDWSIKAGFFC